MRLSIMFITYNRKIELIRAIKSCLDNLIDDMEFVVVDNNSNDGTKDAVIELLSKYCVKFNYYYSPENLGVAGGRNKGFSLCTGKYVFCLDDDAVLVSENFLQNTCEYMERNLQVGALAYKIYEPSTDKYLIGKLEKGKSMDEESDCLNYLGGAHTIRKSLFQDKLYPENLQFGAEELYASHLIWEKGSSVKYIPELLVYHLPVNNNRTLGKERDYNFILNQYIVRLLNYPFVLRVIASVLFILRLIKNDLFSRSYHNRIKHDLKIRLVDEEKYKLKYKTIFVLLKKYGIINII